MSFKFGPQTKKGSIRVGYIDPNRGYISGVSLCAANTYAKNNPGTIFIFVDGDRNIRYLNINEVNELTENDVVSSSDECGGIQTYKECTSPEIVIYGGGGIGASGNPVIGVDGALLAVDLVSGGFGYQFPPLASAVDNCQIGNGATLQTVLGTVVDTVEGGAPFEIYEECPEDAPVEYGRLYDENGQDVGEWSPANYLPVPGEDPILLDIREFQESLKNPWWTTRDNKPLRVTSGNETFTAVDVSYPPWVDAGFSFLNEYPISPIAPSDVPGSDNAGKTFTFEWQEDFPTTGEYVFRAACDNLAELYIDNVFVSDIFLSQKVITKQIQEGIHTIRVDLVNSPEYEIITVTTTPGTAFFIKKDGEIYLDLTSFPKSAVNVTFSTYSISDGDEARDHTIDIPGAELIFKDRKDVSNDSGTYGVPGGVLHGPIFQTGGDRLAIVEGRQKEVDKGIEIVSYTGNKIAGGKDDFFIAIVGAELIEQPQPEPQPETEEVVIISSTQEVSTESELKPKFVLEGSNVYLQVDGSGTGEITFEMDVDDNPNFAGIAAREVSIPSDDGSIVLKRDPTEEYDSDKERGKFTAGRSYGPIEIIGAGPNARGPVVNNKKRLGLLDADGDDENIKIRITDIISDISTTTGTTTTRLEKVQSSRSWNQNPMAISMVIEQPPRAIPQEEIPPVSDPCPPNPIWSTRFPGYTEQWFPVNFTERDTWSDFMNRYALSPVPPLDTAGSDGSGIEYSNSWTIELPYEGFYGVQSTADNVGSVFIDGKEIVKSESYVVENPKITQVFLTKGIHTISVQVLNNTPKASSSIMQKIFSTKDWKDVAGENVDLIDVTFTVTGQGKNTDKMKFSFVGDKDFTIKGNDEGNTSRTVVKSLSPNSKFKVYASSTKEGGVEQGIIKNGTKNQEGGEGDSNTIFADHIQSDNDNDDMQITTDFGTFRASNKTKGDEGRNTFDLEFDLSEASVSLEPEYLTETRNGVTYNGPPLFGYSHTTGGPDGTGWGDFMNEYSISPKTFREINQPDNNIDGVFVLIWRGVSFPETGTYQVRLAADNEAVLKSDGVEIARSSDFLSNQPSAINVNFSAGTHDITVELQNFDDGINIFETNPMGVSLLIEKEISFLVENTGADWIQNPMAISAILIPPPCILKTGGTGVVTDIIVTDPGNGYIPPSPTNEGYPVLLELSEIIVENPGINYSCGVDQIQIVPDLGANPTYTCDTFGRIQSVQVAPTAGYTSYPSITMPSDTGVNASFRPVFRVVRDPAEFLNTQLENQVEDQQLIQVTDLVGLKQTGYVDGRAYYGAVYYENGIRFAGYYKTIGTPIRVYDTLQESITGEVTTAPSAIQRSGTDITSNDPTLNIPGTPQNLT